VAAISRQVTDELAGLLDQIEALDDDAIKQLLAGS
jgi:hypothetical protein